MNRRLAERMLRRLNCEVFTAEGLEDAAGILGTEPVDIVFSDLEMPGADIAELASYYRRLVETAFPDRNRLRVVAVSGDGLGKDPAAYQAVGFDDYLPKPINLNALKIRLDAVTALAD